ncbi:MAG TPA: hypothetical protein PLC65_16740, partial [Bacteroidia bacterium]|nr:hypothetical protein [Bacteroidia bacterium]
MRTLLAIVIIIFLSCTSNDAKKESNSQNLKKDSVIPPIKEVEPVKDSVVAEVVSTEPALNYLPFNADNYFNNVTAVLSGLKGQAHKFNYLFDSIAWSRHQFYVDSSWKKLEARRLKAMRMAITSKLKSLV